MRWRHVQSVTIDGEGLVFNVPPALQKKLALTKIAKGEKRRWPTMSSYICASSRLASSVLDQMVVHCETPHALNTGWFLNVLFRNGSGWFGFNEGRRTEECVTLVARSFSQS